MLARVEVSPVPIISLILSSLGLLGALAGWLILDTREKTRAALTAESVRDLKARDQQHGANIIKMRADLDNASKEIARKAEHATLDVLHEYMKRIDGRLDKIDNRFEEMRKDERERARDRD